MKTKLLLLGIAIIGIALVWKEEDCCCSNEQPFIPDNRYCRKLIIKDRA